MAEISMQKLSEKDMNEFSKSIIGWFKGNKRDYPWRNTDDPFKLLIAEIMLRRTKADQVKPVYEKVFQEYPDIQSLATAKESRISEIIYPLGLRWRVSSLRNVANEIIERHNGRVPMTRKELLELSGVGEYIAGVLLSVAFRQNEWIVDSNVARIFKRYFGIETISEGRRDKRIIETAKLYALSNNPRDAHLAILDFAASICTPRNPLHEKCPIKRKCDYYCNKTVDN